MDRATIRLEIRDRLGETAENFWKNTHIDRAIDEAQYQFNREERWPWLFTVQGGIVVASGQTTIELIDNVPYASHFSLILTKTGDANLYLPVRVTPANGVKLRSMYITPSMPMYYYIHSTVNTAYGDGDEATALMIRLIPTPNVALVAEYHYIREPVAITSDSQEPDLPEQYHEAVISFATGTLWLKELNGGTKAQEQFNIYNAVLAQARKDYTEPANDDLIIWGGEKPEFDRRSWYDTHIPGPVGVP